MMNGKNIFISVLGIWDNLWTKSDELDKACLETFHAFYSFGDNNMLLNWSIRSHEIVNVIIGLLGKEKPAENNLILLSLLNKILYLGECGHVADFKNLIFGDSGMLTNLEMIQDHKDKKVSDLCSIIIEKYFDCEIDD